MAEIYASSLGLGYTYLSNHLFYIIVFDVHVVLVYKVQIHSGYINKYVKTKFILATV